MRSTGGFVAGGRSLLVVTSARGANRVYETTVNFPVQRVGSTLTDDNGHAWRVTESALVLGADPTVRAPRVRAQRAFWSGWYAQFPDTLLIR